MSEAGQELVHLVWGKKAGPRGLADTIFCRWAQGSNFEKQGRVKLRQFMPSIRSLKNVKQIQDF